MYNESKYQAEYRKEHYDMITCKVTKTKDFKQRLKVLSIGKGISVNQLIIEAIEEYLTKHNA